MSDPVSMQASEATSSAATGVALQPGGSIFHGVEIALVLAVLVGAWLASRGSAKAVRLVWDAGADPLRRLALLKLGVDLLLAAFVVWFGLREITTLAASSSVVAVGLLFVLVGVGIYPELQNLIAGFSISGTEQVRAGDKVSFDDIRAEVLGVGLTHVDLQTDEGGFIFVPNRVFRSKVIQVDRAQRAWPVDVELRGFFSEERLERLRIAAVLCPFRTKQGKVSVSHGPATSQGFEGARVKLTSWSSDGARRASRYVERIAQTN